MTTQQRLKLAKELQKDLLKISKENTLDPNCDIRIIEEIMATTEHNMKPNTILEDLYINNEGNIFQIPKKIKISIDEKGKVNMIINNLKPIRK